MQALDRRQVPRQRTGTQPAATELGQVRTHLQLGDLGEAINPARVEEREVGL